MSFADQIAKAMAGNAKLTVDIVVDPERDEPRVAGLREVMFTAENDTITMHIPAPPAAERPAGAEVAEIMWLPYQEGEATGICPTDPDEYARLPRSGLFFTDTLSGCRVLAIEGGHGIWHIGADITPAEAREALATEPHRALDHTWPVGQLRKAALVSRIGDADPRPQGFAPAFVPQQYGLEAGRGDAVVGGVMAEADGERVVSLYVSTIGGGWEPLAFNDATRTA